MRGAQILVSDSTVSGGTVVVSDGPAEYPLRTEADEHGSDIALLWRALRGKNGGILTAHAHSLKQPDYSCIMLP